MTKAEFCFPNNFIALTRQGNQELLLVVDRKMRTKPFQGMKQPVPYGAVMGYEAYLTILHMGRPAKDFAWELWRGDKLVQQGKTDTDGYSGDLDIELVDGLVPEPLYRVAIYVPETPQSAAE